ncbi:MAG: iron-containing alcohol dehydrogenase [Chloroflexi bacterium]|nr:iron-containing alcohol dehydrogenase [Chloroflexota bacterium]MBM3183425.1 iron-containing alcohol dehydrogenase [Chloroflexota bacterium]MBM4453082.1 iron-containing alcohol dehydrogenase [Chloroflexota bacterium]
MWYFTAPQVVFGEDALSKLAELSGKSAFIVTDKIINGLGLIDKVKEHLAQAGMHCQVFDEVEPDPSLQTVKKGIALMQQYKPDWVVAVGGGSVMDAAKAMRVEYERPDIKADEINPFITDLGLGKKCKIACVPTTSGTGAEVTFAVVLTDTADQRKLSLINREIVPDIAIVDPVCAASMPPGITSNTGMDALTHAVEGFTCNWKNDFTDGLCLKAIQLVFQYLPKAVKDGKDMEAREKMANAATIAGIGFVNSLAALAHAMGHSLGGVFHTPHGRAVGLFLPYTIEFMGDAREEQWADIVRFLGIDIPKGKKASAVLAQAIRGLAKEINEPTSLKELGIPQDKLNAAMPKLMDNVQADGSLIVSARVPNEEETVKLFNYAYEGKSIDF